MDSNDADRHIHGYFPVSFDSSDSVQQKRPVTLPHDKINAICFGELKPLG